MPRVTFRPTQKLEVQNFENLSRVRRNCENSISKMFINPVYFAVIITQEVPCEEWDLPEAEFLNRKFRNWNPTWSVGAATAGPNAAARACDCGCWRLAAASSTWAAASWLSLSHGCGSLFFVNTHYVCAKSVEPKIQVNDNSYDQALPNGTEIDKK